MQSFIRLIIDETQNFENLKSDEMQIFEIISEKEGAPPANVANGLSLCHIALNYSSTISASQTFSVSTSGQQNFAVPGSLPGTVPP